MTLAQRISTALDERELTLRAAALELGCSPNQLRLWKLGVSIPGAERLERIRNWLGVDADTLLRELAATPGYLAFAS